MAAVSLAAVCERATPITVLTDIIAPAASAAPVRSEGRATLSARPRGAGTGIGRLLTSGCLKLLFPDASGPLTCVLLNTSGGVTGGDRLAVDLTAEAGAALCMTTQAAERIYRASAGTARIDNRLTVGPGATLDWLPQETILFDQSALERRLSADVAPGGRLLIAEAVIFGRRLSGERLQRIAFTDRISVTRGGVPMLSDATRVDGSDTLARGGLAAGAGAMATLVLVDPDAPSLADPLRRALGDAGGVSVPRPGLLCARLLAEDGFAMRQGLARALPVLAGSPVPPSWRL